MATDQGNKLIRDNNGEVPIVAVVGVDGNGVGAGGAPASGTPAATAAAPGPAINLTTTNADATAIAAFDMMNYSSIAVQIEAVGVGASINYEVSNNSTNGLDGVWSAKSGSSSSNGSAEQTNDNAVATREFEVPERWFRVRQTAITSGTTSIRPYLANTVIAPRSVFATLGAGTAAIGSTLSGIGYQESLTPLAAAGSVTGTARDLGGATGATVARSYFTGSFFADQAGTAFVEGSWDGTTWYPRNGTAGTALAAGSSLDIKVPATFRYNRTRYVNGATLNTKFSMTSMYSQS